MPKWEDAPIVEPQTPEAPATGQMGQEGGAAWQNAPVVEPSGGAAEGQKAPQADDGSMFGDAMSAVGEGAMATGQWVADAVTGPEGLPDLPEFDAPAPGGALDTAVTAGGLMAAMTPGQRRDIIEKNYPGAEIETVEKDDKTYNIVNWKNPDTGEEFRGYINAPGLTFRDVTQIAGQTAAFTPAARLGKGLSALPRLWRVGAGSGATSAGLDLAAQQAGAEEGVSPTRAGIAAAGGVAGEALSPLAAKVFQRLRGGSKYFDKKTGDLTPLGKREAKRAGVSPEEMRAIGQEGRRTFAQYPEAGVDPEIGARVARAQEFDVPLTRGQATQGYSQLNAEERMRRGLMGTSPESAMREFGRQQEEGVERAAGTVQQRMGGAGAGREAEAAEGVMTSVRGAARRLKEQIDEAYEGVRGQEFAVSPQSAERLPSIVENAVEDIDLTPDLTPAATRSVDIVGELADAVAKGNGTKFETFRRRLGNQIGSAANDTDRMAAARIKGAFDEWMDDAIDRGMFEGNPETIQMLKEARSLRKQYGDQFEPRGRTDSAGKVMQNIVEKAETPEDVVNYIYGQSQLGRNKATTSAVQRIKESIGEDSEAWRGIKETAWLRLSRNKQGNWIGGKAFKKNLEELRNRNRSLYNTLFDEEERGLIERFSKAVETTDPPATNPSGTAFGLENALRYTLRRLGQRESFTKGNVGRGTILNFLARMRVPVVADTISGGAAGRAMDVRPPSPRSPGFTAGTTEAATVGSEMEGQNER